MVESGSRSDAITATHFGPDRVDRGALMALEPPLDEPLRIMPMSLIRSQALAAFPSPNSVVIDRRFQARATVEVVPLPQNGSSTRSPSFEQERITLSR